MKLRFSIWTLIIPVLIISGICMTVYPFISNYLNDRRSDTVIAQYSDTISNSDSGVVATTLASASAYNEILASSDVILSDPFTLKTNETNQYNYNALLALEPDSTTNSIMSYIEIPKIDVYLPIYHGTEAKTLENGVGHLEGSSLPIGGESTHCVLTGHTGLSSAKIFTDLSKLETGDYFFLHTLGETLAYRVNKIDVVLPSDLSTLSIQTEQDLVTLVTCTPYGVNTHRLLVTGCRTEYTEQVQEEIAVLPKVESQWMDVYKKALCAGAVIIAVTLILFVIIWRIVCRTKVKKAKE